MHLSQALRFKDGSKFFVAHSLNADQATITTSVIATFWKTFHILPTSSSSSSVVVVIIFFFHERIAVIISLSNFYPLFLTKINTNVDSSLGQVYIMLEMRLLKFKKLFVMIQTGVCSNAWINAYCCKKNTYQMPQDNYKTQLGCKNTFSTVEEGAKLRKISLLYANLYRYYFVKCRLSSPHNFCNFYPNYNRVFNCLISLRNLKLLCHNNIKAGNYTA